VKFPGATHRNIYVRSLAAGQRVMESVTGFLEGKLKLRVNREKSAVAPVGERKFLGHRLLLNGQLGISPKSADRAKEKIRQITSRSRGVSFAQVIVELNLFLVGWIVYYRFAAFRGELTRMTSGFGAGCAATASSSANAASPSPGYSGSWACPPHRQAEWVVPARGRGVSPIALRSTEPCRSDGSTLRDSSHLSPNMTRYTINETAVYIQVSTVVWEDGAVRPLLPDRILVWQQQSLLKMCRPAVPARIGRQQSSFHATQRGSLNVTQKD
jgi:hypothetical protein